MIASQDSTSIRLQDEIKTSLEAMRKIDDEIERLEEAKESAQKNICRSLPPIFCEKLHGWTPKVGDSAVVIHFPQQSCYEIIVTKVTGSTVRAQEGDKNCFHTFELQMPANDYYEPVFVVSVALYQELKPVLGFPFLPTMIARGENYRSVIPTWA